MNDVITRLVDVPFARMFVLAGIIFLMIAVLGKVEGKIEPGSVGRVGAAVLGVILMLVGIAMQYIEIREASLDRSGAHAQVAPADAAKQSDAAAAPAADRPAIKTVSGTYGKSCEGKPGNATALLAKACDGKTACDYTVEPVPLGEAQANCAKDFTAEWKCGSSSAVFSATLPADAGRNEKLHLACAG